METLAVPLVNQVLETNQDSWRVYFKPEFKAIENRIMGWKCEIREFKAQARNVYTMENWARCSIW
jgi:hypothetical protein